MATTTSLTAHPPRNVSIELDLTAAAVCTAGRASRLQRLLVSFPAGGPVVEESGPTTTVRRPHAGPTLACGPGVLVVMLRSKHGRSNGFWFACSYLLPANEFTGALFDGGGRLWPGRAAGRASCESRLLRVEFNILIRVHVGGDQRQQQQQQRCSHWVARASL